MRSLKKEEKIPRKNFKSPEKLIEERRKIIRRIEAIPKKLEFLNRKLLELFWEAESHSVEAQFSQEKGEDIKEKHFIADEEINRIDRLQKKIKILMMDYKEGRV